MLGLSLNKALLWKEWTQHKLKIITAFLILSVSTLWVPILNIFLMSVDKLKYYIITNDMEKAWSFHAHRVLDIETGTMEIIGIFLAAAFGIMLLNQEKTEGTLEFTLTKPVSRKEIIFNKFLFGVFSLSSIVAINGLFLILAALVLPAYYSIGEVIAWSIIIISGLVAIFTFGLLIATLINGRFNSLLTAYLLLYLPNLIKDLWVDVFYVNEIGNYLISIKYAQKFFNALTLPWYLDVRNRTYHVYTSNSLTVHIDGINLYIDTPLLMLFTIIFLALAVKIFAKISLERQQSSFMFPVVGTIYKAVLGLFLGSFLGAVVAIEFHRWFIGVLTGVLVFAVIFYGLSLMGRIGNKYCSYSNYS